MSTMSIAPEVIAWALRRSQRELSYFDERFPKIGEWLRGDSSPSFAQLKQLSAATYTPYGYFFLSSPPSIALQVPDFRTIGNGALGDPSPNLIDTIAICELRQSWYREWMVSNDGEPLDYVGSLQGGEPSRIPEVAQVIRKHFGFEVADRAKYQTWESALRSLVGQTEERGILVMVSGIVGNNTHRTLDPDEFRGFALADRLAPVIFINGRDAKAAQIFTLMHEIVHIGLGREGVSRPTLRRRPADGFERWCNDVAAEVLIPLDDIRGEFNVHGNMHHELARLCRKYKVSSLVVLRRLRDARLLTKDEFESLYSAEWEQFEPTRHSEVDESSGGSFYNTARMRLSSRFARALIGSTLAGTTQYKEALTLLGIAKTSTLEELGRRLGVA